MTSTGPLLALGCVSVVSPEHASVPCLSLVFPVLRTVTERRLAGGEAPSGCMCDHREGVCVLHQVQLTWLLTCAITLGLGAQGGGVLCRLFPFVMRKYFLKEGNWRQGSLALVPQASPRWFYCALISAADSWIILRLLGLSLLWERLFLSLPLTYVCVCP